MKMPVGLHWGSVHSIAQIVCVFLPLSRAAA
jgi:hypothetical protein